jgi:hypothetical protein
MTSPDPVGYPNTERPIDLTNTPQRISPGPAPTPEHHPDDGGMFGEGIGTPGPHVPRQD